MISKSISATQQASDVNVVRSTANGRGDLSSLRMIRMKQKDPTIGPGIHARMKMFQGHLSHGVFHRIQQLNVRYVIVRSFYSWHRRLSIIHDALLPQLCYMLR
jgi:hypothetical protein